MGFLHLCVGARIITLRYFQVRIVPSPLVVRDKNRTKTVQKAFSARHSLFPHMYRITQPPLTRSTINQVGVVVFLHPFAMRSLLVLQPLVMPNRSRVNS